MGRMGYLGYRGKFISAKRNNSGCWQKGLEPRRFHQSKKAVMISGIFILMQRMAELRLKISASLAVTQSKKACEEAGIESQRILVHGFPCLPQPVLVIQTIQGVTPGCPLHALSVFVLRLQPYQQPSASRCIASHRPTIWVRTACCNVAASPGRLQHNDSTTACRRDVSVNICNGCGGAGPREVVKQPKPRIGSGSSPHSHANGGGEDGLLRGNATGCFSQPEHIFL